MIPDRPWLLIAAAALLTAAGALIGTDGRPVAAGALLALGAVCIGAWIVRGDDPPDIGDEEEEEPPPGAVGFITGLAGDDED